MYLSMVRVPRHAANVAKSRSPIHWTSITALAVQLLALHEGNDLIHRGASVCAGAKLGIYAKTGLLSLSDGTSVEA